MGGKSGFILIFSPPHTFSFGVTFRSSIVIRFSRIHPPHLDLAPGIEIRFEGIIELRLGRPGVVDVQRHLESTHARAVTRGELQSADDRLAAIELVADLATAARRFGYGADEVVVVVPEPDALDAHEAAAEPHAGFDIEALFLVRRAAGRRWIEALVHAR